MFAGKLVRKQLSFPEGDFRDWPAITSWAAGIANALRSRSSAEAGHPGATPLSAPRGT